MAFAVLELDRESVCVRAIEFLFYDSNALQEGVKIRWKDGWVGWLKKCMLERLSECMVEKMTHGRSNSSVVLYWSAAAAADVN